MGKRITLKQTAYRQIMNDIIDGIYTTESILSEHQIMDTYGFSKSTVREALIELCKDNVLESLPRIGYRVKAISLMEISQIVDLRVTVETLALRKAFKNLTDDFLEKLREKVIENNKNPQTGLTNKLSVYWQSNREFHLGLNERSNNKYIMKVLSELIDHCSRCIPQYYQVSWSHSREKEGGKFHLAIIDALYQKDIEKAVELLQQDIVQIKEELIVSAFRE